MKSLDIYTVDDFGSFIAKLKPNLDEIKVNEKQIRKLEWYHKSTVPKHKESGKIRAK